MEPRRTVPGLVLRAALAACAVAELACGTARPAPGGAPSPVAVATPRDAIPVRDTRVWLPAGAEDGATTTLHVLRADLADALSARGAAICETDLALGPADGLEPAAIGRQGRSEGVAAVVVAELVAYGQVRRSWLGLLVAQGFAAGVGHGVAASQLAGPTAGWWVGLGEFALETVTWVGGAVLAAHVIDPVIIRISVVRARDGAVIGQWTVSGTRPFREWWARRGEPPRPQRLRTVAEGLFRQAAPRIVRRIAEQCPSPTRNGVNAAPAGAGGTT